MSTLKRKNITLLEKYEIVKLIKSGTKQSEIAKSKKIPASTLTSYVKNADKIIEQYETTSSSLKRFKSHNFEDIDRPLLDFFRMARDKKIPVSGEMLVEKAQQFASALNYSESNVAKLEINWVNRWKRRNDVVCKKLHGEAASVDENAVTEWVTNEIPVLLQEFNPSEIFNCDETGLFYR